MELLELIGLHLAFPLLKKLLGPTFEDFGKEIASRLKRRPFRRTSFRRRTLRAINEKCEQRCKALGLDPKNAQSLDDPALGLLFIDKASLQDDEFLQQRWANLLVSFMDPNSELNPADFQLDTTYIEIMSQFSKLDCQVLDYIVEHGLAYRYSEDQQGGDRNRQLTAVPVVPDTIFEAHPGSLAHISVEKLVYLGCAYREPRTPLSPYEGSNSYGGLQQDIVPTLIGLNLALSASGKTPSWLQADSP